MFGWHIQETTEGNFPTIVDLRTGAYLVVAETGISDEPNLITSYEIATLRLAAENFCQPTSGPIVLRLFRFGFIDKDGALTEEGEVALAQLEFQRSGILDFSRPTGTH